MLDPGEYAIPWNQEDSQHVMAFCVWISMDLPFHASGFEVFNAEVVDGSHFSTDGQLHGCLFECYVDAGPKIASDRAHNKELLFYFRHTLSVYLSQHGLIEADIPE